MVSWIIIEQQPTGMSLIAHGGDHLGMQNNDPVKNFALISRMDIHLQENALAPDPGSPL